MKGFSRKARFFLVVILATQLDRMTGSATAIFRTSTAFFFVANEGLSMLENVAEMGVKLPKFLTAALAKISQKNDNEDAGTGGDSE